MERLLAMQERWEANNARAAFNRAITSIRAELPAIVRTGVVDRTTDKNPNGGKFRHETMQDIADQINPILSAHGVSYRFRTDSGTNGVTVTCVLMHELGHTEENSLTAPMDTSGGKNNVQGIGSSQTYLQRYTLRAALGLAIAKDDDGKSSELKEVEPITAQQAELIAAKLEEKGRTVAQWLAHFKLDDLESMPASTFDERFKWLCGLGKKAVQS
jgi:hypothetical protein